MRLVDADAPPISFDGHTVSVWKKDLDAAPAVNPYEWISVEDRLPEHNVKCLVFLPYGHLYTGIHVAYYSDKRNMWVDIDGTYLFDHPTHWTPLPTPPTEKGE